jgi:hypothetical protein
MCSDYNLDDDRVFSKTKRRTHVVSKEASSQQLHQRVVESNNMNHEYSPASVPLMVSDVYCCTVCGGRWRIKDPSVTKEQLEKHDMDMDIDANGAFSPVSSKRTASSGAQKVKLDSLQISDVLQIKKSRVCSSCRVRKHRKSLKNPFQTTANTGKMPTIIKRTLHDVDNPARDVLCITYDNFWLSQFCIRANCIRRAQKFGFCHVCYNLFRGSPSPDAVLFSPDKALPTQTYGLFDPAKIVEGLREANELDGLEHTEDDS